MRTGILGLAFMLLMQPVFAADSPPPKPGLTALLEAELAHFPSKSGFYVKHLTTGEEASVNGAMHFESASTIKLATLVLAFRMADAKQLDLNERVVLKPDDMRGGSGVFRYKGPGLNPTVRDLLTEMVITSDNTSTDLMMAKVGGIAKIVEFLRANGFTAIRPNFTTFEYFRNIYATLDPKYATLGHEDVFALCCAATTLPNFPALTPARAALVKEVREHPGNAKLNAALMARSADEKTWFGIATPAEIGKLLEGIEKGTLASAASSDEMRRMLRNTVSSGTAVASALKLYISPPIGHKTGDTTGVTNDVGIVYAKSGPIVMAAYNMNIAGPTGEISERVGRVARLVLEYFDGAS
jgi:beta-lactamase class A